MSDRIELLKQQKELHNQHCAICPNRYDRNAKSCRSCDIFSQLKAIGIQLIQRNNRQPEQGSLKKSTKDILAESMTAHGMVLTIDRYLDLQDNGMNNSDIAEKYEITTKELNEWKVWQGLNNKRGPVSKKELAHSS